VRPETSTTGAPSNASLKAAVSIVAEVMMIFSSGRLNRRVRKWPRRKSMLSDRSCASSRMIVS